MVALVVVVAEFQRRAARLDHIHLLGRGKPDVGRLAGSDVADDALHERAEVPRRAVVHFEHDGWVPVVADRHSFSQIVCCCHKWGANNTPAARHGKARKTSLLLEAQRRDRIQPRCLGGRVDAGKQSREDRKGDAE